MYYSIHSLKAVHISLSRPAKVGSSRRFLFHGIGLCLFLFLGAPDGAAQEVIIAGSERTENTRKEPPPTTNPKPLPVPARPVPARPRPVVYLDFGIVPDDDCILTIDGVKQRDTLRAGEKALKKLTTGNHRLIAESVATGFVFSRQVKVDVADRAPFNIPVKEEFEAHMKRVETALARQQQ